MTSDCMDCRATLAVTTLLNAATAVGLVLLLATQGVAAEVNCLACHRMMTQKKVVHAAVHMGCPSCHANLDASRVPHQNKGPFAKGLLAEVPALCGNCHDQSMFEGRMVHAPVSTGLCLGCHNPHATDYQGLLNMKPVLVCLDCHPDIKNSQHLITGLSSKGHPLGDRKEAAQDPKRPGKKFYCASCHEPHRSTLPKLTRYGIGMSSCQTCHEK